MGCLLRLFSVFSPFCTELTESSRELGPVHRVLPSFSRYTLRLVPGNGINLVSPESVMNRPSRTGLGLFFEPWLHSKANAEISMSLLYKCCISLTMKPSPALSKLSFLRFTSFLCFLSFLLFLKPVYGVESLFHFCSSSENFIGNDPYETNLNKLIGYLYLAAPPTGFRKGSVGQNYIRPSEGACSLSRRRLKCRLQSVYH